MLKGFFLSFSDFLWSGFFLPLFPHLNTFKFFLLTRASADGVPITRDFIKAFNSFCPVFLKFSISNFCCKSADILVNTFTKPLFSEMIGGNKSEPFIAMTSFLMLFSATSSSFDEKLTEFEATMPEKTPN